jgi:hypothetical protein
VRIFDHAVFGSWRPIILPAGVITPSASFCLEKDLEVNASNKVTTRIEIANQKAKSAAALAKSIREGDLGVSALRGGVAVEQYVGWAGSTQL